MSGKCGKHIKGTSKTMIVPQPKSIHFGEGRFSLSAKTTICTHDHPVGVREAKALAALLEQGTGFRPRIVPVAADGQIELKIVSKLAGVPDREEGYTIHVTPKRVVLSAVTDRGLFYAGQSLLDLIEPAGDQFAISACEVRDWPDFRYRGYMADPARYFLPLARLKWEIDNLARNKFNAFHIHFTDSESFTLPARCFPRLNNVPPGPHGVYSRAEIKELCRYAEERKIKIVPELEMPGHAQVMCRQYPKLKCCPPHGKASEWTFCIGAEQNYHFLERLLDEMVQLFPGKLFHIGTDELEFEDDIDRVFVSWRTCPECRARMKSEGLANHRELFYYFLRRIHAMLKKHGSRMMMWNDNIDISKPVSLPRDILIQYWRIAAKGRGPWRGCSMRRFLQAGFEVVNSNYPETYFEYNTDERRVRWNPRKFPPIPRSLDSKVIGGEGCAWSSENEKENWEQALPSALALFADRLWNQAPLKDADAFARAVPRHIFGPRMPSELQPLFLALGRISSPPALSWLPHPSDIAYLTPLPEPQRLAMLGDLLRCLRRECKNGQLMNAANLAKYAMVLERLQHELLKK